MNVSEIKTRVEEEELVSLNWIFAQDYIEKDLLPSRRKSTSLNSCIILTHSSRSSYSTFEEKVSLSTLLNCYTGAVAGFQICKKNGIWPKRGTTHMDAWKE